MVGYKDIAEAIHKYGLRGKNVCVHSSIKSFGGLEGGQKMIIDAFIENECTLLVPTFTYMYAVPPPEHLRPEQNGWDYSKIKEYPSPPKENYSVDSVIINTEEMGILPETILKEKNRIRGNHPLNSFSAIGKNAYELIKGQAPLDVYYPLEKLVNEDGFVLLMGVDYDKMTLIHLAEKKAGRNLFKRWAKDNNGNTIMVYVGCCSDGFTNFSKYFKEIVKETTVGKSLWKILNAQEALTLATKLIKDNPDITRCKNNCERCRDAISGGPKL